MRLRKLRLNWSSSALALLSLGITPSAACHQLSLTDRFNEYLWDVERLPFIERPDFVSAATHRVDVQSPANTAVQGVS